VAWPLRRAICMGLVVEGECMPPAAAGSTLPAGAVSAAGPA
jgi:hypothetical protein